MTNRFFYKVIALIALYALIIVGIFTLQFRNESVMRRILGNFRFVVSYYKDENKNDKLNNSFQLTYKDLHLFFDEKNPVQLHLNKNSEKPLILQSVSEENTALTLFFDNNISIEFLSSDTVLAIRANIPQNGESISIPYKLLNSPQKTLNERSMLITTRKEQFMLSGVTEVTNTAIVLSGGMQAKYAEYVPSKEFTLTQIESLPLSQNAAYTETLAQFRFNALDSFKRSLNATVTERTVIAYIAQMASENQYTEALDSVPSIFKTGPNRTYLSAPYFNSLARMNTGYQTELQSRKLQLNSALADNSIAVISIDSLLQVLQQTAQLSQIPYVGTIIANNISSLNAYQAACVLAFYADIAAYEMSYRQYIEPYLAICEKIVLSAFVNINELYFISLEKNTVNTTTNIRIADMLIRYGQAIHNTSWQQGGFLLINSLFALTESGDSVMEEYTYYSDMSSISGSKPINPSVLYSLLVTDNTYYPHTVILNTQEPLWAWTVAEDVSYKKDASSATISVTFPQGETHYMIISGIEPFSSIQLYGLDFRTDPQFESYNSAGYIYLRETKTLLIKMRHRSIIEDIKFIY